MSKYIKQIQLDSIEHISIVLGNGRLAGKVKTDTGADYVCNAGFYNGSKPTHHLKIDGQVLARADWGCWGYAWDSGGDIKMEALPAETRRNYIAGVELLSPMVDDMGRIPYDPKGELGGKRGRTAMALGVGALILYCSGDGTSDAATPETLQDELYKLGAETAIMLDGGGSSQCDFGGGNKIVSSRPVHNYLCVWLREEKKEDKPMVKTVCLDPGHGVEVAGKCAPDKSYYEHEFNLDMSKRLRTLLERHGVSVTVTRETQHDETLEKRVAIANAIKGLDLFVSLHSNASGDGTGWTAPDGYGIYTSAAGATAGRNIAANKILTRAREAGVKIWGGGIFHEMWYVCKNAVAPAVLIEHGFHTNRSEVELLKSSAYRQKLAEVDCKGILDYLGIAWQDEKPAGGNDSGADIWAAAAWQKAKDKGILDGTRPTEPVSRQELAVVLDRLNLI